MPETRTYEIVTAKGRQRVTVPEETKVTFGAVVPGSSRSAGSSYSNGGWGLRLWAARDRQVAVFTDVISFRDLALPVVVAAVRKFGAPEDDWFVDDGSWVGGKADKVQKAWMPIDEVREQAPMLGRTDEDDDAFTETLTRKRF